MKEKREKEGRKEEREGGQGERDGGKREGRSKAGMEKTVENDQNKVESKVERYI